MININIRNMNNLDCLVSVVVPVYNVEKYIDKCIESIISQTYKYIEIILVDDGSSDKSGEIVDNYAKKDSRIKVVHKKNSGVSAARNTGINVAEGDYICFADGDDVLMEDYVEYLLNLCIDNKADVAYTKDMFTTFYKKQIESPNIFIYTPEEATEAILCYNVPIGVYSKMFRKKFLDEYNIRFDENIYIGEGFNFNTSCFQRANKIVMSTHRIYFYRRDNDASAMTNFKLDKCKMALYAIENIKKNLVIKTPRILKAWNFAYWHTHFDMYCWIKNSGKCDLDIKLYHMCKNVSRKFSFVAFALPVKRTEKIRAILGLISPSIVAKLILLRSKRH